MTTLTRLRPLARVTSRPTPWSLAVVRSGRGGRCSRPAHGAGPRGRGRTWARRCSSLAAARAAEEVHRVARRPRRRRTPGGARRAGHGRRATRRTTTEVLRRAAGAAVRSLTGRPTGRRRAARRRRGAGRGRRRGRAARRLRVRWLPRRPEREGRRKAVVAAGGRLRAGTRPPAAAAQRAGILAEAQDYARDLVNTPPNELFPAAFADPVKARGAAGQRSRSTVLDEKALVKAGLRRHRRRRPGLGQPAAARHASTWPAPRARRRTGRAGRQGHHLRLRRPVHQAGRPPC